MQRRSTPAAVAEHRPDPSWRPRQILAAPAHPRRTAATVRSAVRVARSRLVLSRRAEVAGAVAAAAASLTPSLLPKTVLVQGVVAGMAAAAGYAAAALLYWVLAPVRRHVAARSLERVGWVLLGAATLWLLPAGWRGHAWQRDLAASVGQRHTPATNAVLALLLAGAAVTGLVLAVRTLRAVIRSATTTLSRWLPHWLAVTVAALAVSGLATALTDGVVRHNVLTTVDDSFRVVNRQTSPDLRMPSDPLRSGGPGSLVRWSQLGHTGQEFISLPDPPGGLRPIRVYAGIDSTADLRTRADLVIAELERTGGLHRAVVCVVVATGTGWVDPTAVTALEAQWAGDTAIASMQYSYLPSALSLAIDRLRVDDAANALVGAVVRRWRTLPAPRRPRLVLFGESLGSRGVEVAMRTVPGANDLVDGVLLVGPLNSNPTWSWLVAHRDPGSPMLAPVVDGGRAVRFWAGPEMPRYDRTRDPWPAPVSGPRTLYLQHPSDPVVWWSPALLWSKPAWVDERTVVARAPPLRWKPVVTFWQVTGDLAFAGEVPRGHGHRYGTEMPGAWAAIAPRHQG